MEAHVKVTEASGFHGIRLVLVDGGTDHHNFIGARRFVGKREPVRV